MKPASIARTVRPNGPPLAFSLQPSAFSSRRGAAIIVVVGLLAILFITAVAFTELMRVSRSASSNYRHMVGARQMLYVGLAQALTDIDRDPSAGGVGDQNYPPWTNRWVTITDALANFRTVTLEEELLPSLDRSTGNAGAVTTAHLLSPDIIKYIPSDLLPNIQGSSVQKPEWVGVNANGSLVGRYAYLAVNASGLLDVNEIAKTNRWMGTTPGEIAVAAGCPPEVLNVNTFTTKRNLDICYETLKDLAANNTGIVSTNIANFETFSCDFNDEIANRAPDYTTATPKYKLYLGGALESRVLNTTPTNYCPWVAATSGSVSNRLVEILSRPDVLGYTMNIKDIDSSSTAENVNQVAYRVNRFLCSLFDYIDTNASPVPRGFSYPKTAQVPLFRRIDWQPKIYFATNLDATVTGHYISTNIYNVVAWNPSGALVGVGAFNAELTIRPLGSPSADANLNSALQPATTLTFPLFSSPPWIYGSVTTANKGADFAYTGQRTPLVTVNYLCLFSMKIRRNSDSQVVEQVPGDFTKGLQIEIPASHFSAYGLKNLPNPWTTGKFPPVRTDTLTNYWTECVDPRINWSTNILMGGSWSTNILMGGSAQWWNDLKLKSFVGSAAWPGFALTYDYNDPWSCFLGQFLQHPDWLGTAGINVICDGFGKRKSGAYWGDALTAQQTMYSCAHRPLQSLGELGYIPLSFWFTVRLARQDDFNESSSGMVPACGYHRMLDYFTLAPPASSNVHGRISLGTRNADVMTAAFLNMPVRDWKPAAAQARSLAQAATMGTLLSAAVKAGVITNMSDFGNIQFWTDPWTNNSALTASCKFDREAVIRNASGLFTTRQQYFTIIVRADSLASRFGYNDLAHSSVLGSAQAIFQVWRDPVADASNGNKHRCFVHLCKIVNQ